ncbi:MAG: DNA primase [Bacteroides sp.]|nr:DNA primase [Bacteroides sp.]
MLNESCKRRIIDAVDIQDVISEYIPLKREGAGWVGRCPFHQDSTPSLKVNPRLNRYKCFVCGASGDGVEFLKQHCNMSFPEAMEWLGKRYNIELKYDRREKTPEEELEGKKRESMWAALSMVQNFFREQLQADTAEAESARKYAFDRWPEEFCAEVGIGFAPKDSRLFLDYVDRKAIPRDVLIELGVIGQSQDTGKQYAQFRQRITIPILNRWGKIIGFTARYVGDDPEIAKSRKYINSSKSLIFQKDSAVFGIAAAKRQAHLSNGFIMVEGAPDVLRLQSLGLTEAVAPLGTALTTKHLEQLRSTSKVIRFIPDSDPPKGKEFGAGILAVMKNGELAMRNGFDVYVKEIPRSKEDDEQQVKRDADSYITSREIYMKLDAVPFVIWIAQKKFPLASGADEKIDLLQKIAALLILIEDEDMRDYCVEQIRKIYGKKQQWTEAMRRAGRKVKEEIEEDNADFSPNEIAIMRKCGIIVRDNKYYSTDKEGNLVRWSNFILRPVFHIKHKENAIRVFRIINEYGREDALELQQKTLATVGSFQTAIESLGAYNWLAKQDQLNKLKEYLYAITESAEEISILGWQKKQDFFAFANGIHASGEFKPIDEHGIVRHGGKNYYLAPFSQMYQDDDGAFQFERIFRYAFGNEAPFRDFAAEIVDAFGDKGMIGIAWILCNIFRDIIFSETNWFPMLNLYGIKGSGKTAFARALVSMFYTLDNDPPKLRNTSVPAMAYILSHIRNAPYILDEYTNLLDDRRIDSLKGIWGGTINTKMDMASGRGITSTPVNSGVIICGQHKPDADPALFSRVIYLYFPSPKFSEQQTRAFKRLKQSVKLGNAHYAMEIMRHRDHFAKNFSAMFEISKDEVISRLYEEKPEERLLDDWVMLLAAVRTLETIIGLPFSYSDLFEVVIKNMLFQQKEMDKSSETSTFWSWLNSMHMVGKITYGTHFVIKYSSSFRSRGSDNSHNFESARPLLFLNWAGINGMLNQAPQGMKMKMDASMLENYLTSCPYYLGEKQQRYTVLMSNGQPDYSITSTTLGTVREEKTVRPIAMVFDYLLLKEQCNIDLETKLVDSNSAEPDEEPPLPPDKPTLPIDHQELDI